MNPTRCLHDGCEKPATDEYADFCEEHVDQHCPKCLELHQWHGRDEKQRVCDECRFGE